MSKPWVPAFTEQGYKVDTIPPRCWRDGWHNLNLALRLLGMLNMLKARGGWQEEPCKADIAPFNCQTLVEDEEECRTKHSGLQEILYLPESVCSLLSPTCSPCPQLKQTLLSSLQPQAEEWSGVPLAGTAVYGVRRYRWGIVTKPHPVRRGAWLVGHLDQLATHVVSAILNIGQVTSVLLAQPLSVW